MGLRRKCRRRPGPGRVAAESAVDDVTPPGDLNVPLLIPPPQSAELPLNVLLMTVKNQ